ncbi:MAG: hypothetical protein FWE01_03325, partial [Firmicutes bacterium]|nr:hypothetical protein [Bacillota bacterium]
LSDGGPMLEFFDQIGGIVGFDTIFAWARQGDEVVRSELIRVARLHNISVPAGVQDVLVNDHVMAYFDISMPEAGVRSRSFFESVAGMTFVETMIALESMNMIRPHIFPEIEAGHIFGMTQSGSMMVEGNWPDFDVWTGSMPQAGVSGQEEAVRVQ